MEKIKAYKKIIIPLLIVGAAVGIFFLAKLLFFSAPKIPSSSFVTAKLGDFVREIELTGTVKPAQDINLSFQLSGQAVKVNVKAGDKVKAGDILAELDKSTLSTASTQAQAALVQAQAALDAQKINKANLLAGAKNEDVAVSETAVQNAQNNLTDTESQAQASLNNLDSQINNSLNDVYAKAYNAVDVQTVGMFYNNNSANPQLSFDTPFDTSAKSDTEAKEVLADAALADLKNQAASLAPDFSNYESVIVQTEKDITTAQDFLSSLNYALQNAESSATLPADLITAYKNSASNALSSLNGVSDSLNSLDQAIILQKKNSADAINAAQNALALAQSQLTLKKSPPTTIQVGLQDTAIKQAEANVISASAAAQNAADQLAKADLRAPLDGIIDTVSLDLGETVSPSVPVITMESAGKFQIETYLPEIYLGQVNPGDSAKINFDAYPGEFFDAQVLSIDPAPTTVNGSPSYRMLLEFNKEDGQIKSGLTANVEIIAEEKKDAILIPESAVLRSADQSFVLLSNGEKQAVSASLPGDNGLTAIYSGLKAGDKVADFGTPDLNTK